MLNYKSEFNTYINIHCHIHFAFNAKPTITISVLSGQSDKLWFGWRKDLQAENKK